MALVIKNRVKETTSTTGTGTITLAGAASGYQAFSVIGDGNTTYYAVVSGTDWEVGVGTYTLSGTTLARTTIIASSNGGSAITLAGTSTVFCDMPAERAVILQANGELLVTSPSATDVPITVRGASAQSDPLTEWQNNSNTVMSSIKADGTAYLKAQTFTSYYDNGNSGTSKTVDWTVVNTQKVTLTGNCTFTFTAPIGPARLVLVLIQDGTGSRTATWPASVKWTGATAAVLTTDASAVDIVSFFYDGTNYYATELLDMR